MARILVLDDEPLISMMLQEWLTELCCETVGPAHSVQRALVLIESECPDAAILDLCVRDETSYPVAAALRARGIPFVFATGYRDKDLDAAFKNEIVVSKPFEFIAIKDVIAKLFAEATIRSPTGARAEALRVP